MIKLLLGDCIEKMKELEDNSIDSIVTDPPYELGFMGKSWDNTGIANNPVMWKEALRVLKPGGHLLAFSGTRTYHRMAVAIEDAGFEVRDMIEWVYGSGFPKSTNIAIRIDKEKGLMKARGVGTSFARKDMGDGKILANGKEVGKHNPISDEAKEWEGWGTALKPAHEPICMARKPLAEKTVAENVLKYGTGGINIDESRVGTEDNLNGGAYSNNREISTNKVYGEYKRIEEDYQQPQGRFPANLIHDNSEEVRECFPNESERFFKSCIYKAKASKNGFHKLDGERRDGRIGMYDTVEEQGFRKVNPDQLGAFDLEPTTDEAKQWNGWGTALKPAHEPICMARKPLAEKTVAENVLKYGTGGINIDESRVESNEELGRNNNARTSGTSYVVQKETMRIDNSGGKRFPANIIHDNSEEVRECFPNESERFFKSCIYKAKASKSGRGEGNNHPTVKPVALMEYLIKMVTPKGGTVLDPFMGSGSTGVAAKTDYNFIGIEMEAEYIKIAEARIGASTNSVV